LTIQNKRANANTRDQGKRNLANSGKAKMGWFKREALAMGLIAVFPIMFGLLLAMVAPWALRHR